MTHARAVIHNLRHERGLTQQQAATAAGVSRRSWRRAEAGAHVRLGTMARIAESLGVPIQRIAPDYFLPEDETEGVAA